MGEVGLKPNPLTSRANSLARHLITFAKNVALPELSREVSVGPFAVTISFSEPGQLTDLVSRGFLPGFPEEPLSSANVFVIQAQSNFTFPNLEWAREWIDANQIIPSSISPQNKIFIDKNQGFVYCYDIKTHEAAVFIRDRSELDLRSLITPFRVLWSWIADEFSATVIHAAALEVDGMGLLISGPSGSGKSTLALAGSRIPGAKIISDDCVLVHHGLAYAVFSRAKISKQMGEVADAFHQSQLETVPNGIRAKFFLDIERQLPNHDRKMKISGLIFPSVYGQTGVFRLTPDDAANRLASDSLREIFGGTQRVEERIRKLGGSTPALRVLLAHSPLKSVEQLEEVIPLELRKFSSRGGKSA